MFHYLGRTAPCVFLVLVVLVVKVTIIAIDNTELDSVDNGLVPVWPSSWMLVHVYSWEPPPNGKDGSSLL